jgi:hypothetical protein
MALRFPRLIPEGNGEGDSIWRKDPARERLVPPLRAGFREVVLVTHQTTGCGRQTERETAMKTRWIGGLVLVGLISAALGMFATRGLSAREEDKVEKGATTGPRYSVVETEGHNLLVTDNKTEVLYFYTIDKDAKIGSDLKLRGKIDLKQVGKDVVKPSDVHIQK